MAHEASLLDSTPTTSTLCNILYASLFTSFVAFARVSTGKIASGHFDVKVFCASAELNAYLKRIDSCIRLLAGGDSTMSLNLPMVQMGAATYSNFFDCVVTNCGNSTFYRFDVNLECNPEEDDERRLPPVGLHRLLAATASAQVPTTTHLCFLDLATAESQQFMNNAEGADEQPAKLYMALR